MHRTRIIFTVVVFFSIAAILAASDPPPLSPSEFPDTPLAVLESSVGWLWSFIASSDVVAVVLTVMSTIAGLLLWQSWVVRWRLGRAVQCLAAGVRETYEEYIRVVQKSHADGKLTSEERDQAMRMALEKAKAYALSQGFDLIKTYAKEFLPVIVERLIGIQKASGRGFPLEPPLPELESR